MSDNKTGENREMEAHRALVADLLPGGNLRPLFESESCLLCNTPEKNPRELYALTDMGHKEPEGEKTSAIGLKVKTKVGSMAPLQIACCSRCRKNYRIAANLRLGIVLLLVALSLLLLTRQSIEGALSSVHSLLPVIAFIAMIPISWGIGTAAANAFIKKKAQETEFDIEEIPFIQQMVDRGWFQLYGKKQVSQLVFSKERLKGDWFTK